jgi:uncharacterized protein YjdB
MARIQTFAKSVFTYFAFILMVLLLSGCTTEEDLNTKDLEIRLITSESITREGNTFKLGVFDKKTGVQDLSANIGDNNQSFELDEYVWTIDTATLASLSIERGYTNELVTFEPGVITVTATNSKNTMSKSVTIAPALLETISISPDDSSMYQGGELSFSLIGNYSDNSIRAINDNITWAIEQSDLATISADGVVKAINVGSTNISAKTTNEFGEIIYTSVVFNVTPAAIVSISITSATDIPLGRKSTVEATATYTEQSSDALIDGITWTMSEANIVNITGNGEIETLAEGEVTITASIDNGYGEEIMANTITLTISAPVIESLNIKPVNPVIDIEMPVISILKTENFIVEATSSIGSIEDVTTRAELIISNSHDEFATVSYNDDLGQISLSTLVEGETSLTVNITNRLNEPLSFSRLISVIKPVLQSIEIIPIQIYFAKGQQTYWQAMGYFDDNTVVDISNQVTWTSSNNSLATFNNASLPNLMSVFEVGQTNITATMLNDIEQIIVSSPVVITLLPAKVVSVKLTQDLNDISDKTLSLPQGVSNSFELIGIFSDGSEKGLLGVDWSSNSELLAEIIDGKVTANKEVGVFGLFTLTASIAIDGGDFISTVDILVTPAKLISMTISLPDPDELGLWKGYSQPLKVMGRFSDGRERTLTDVVQWTFDNTYISKMVLSSTVANTLDLLSDGAVVIQANYVDIYDNNEIKSGEFAFTIKPALLTALTLSAKKDVDKNGVGEEDVTSIASGFKALFYAQGSYSDGSTADITSEVIWASSDSSYLSITDTGLDGGKADALAPTLDDTNLIVSAAIDNAAATNITASFNFSISVAVLESINLSPASASVGSNVPAGKSVQLEIWGTYSDGAYKKIADENAATWGSADTTVGKVNADTGLVTMLAGEVTSLVITAIEKISGNNIKGSVRLNRVDAVVDSIRIEPDTLTQTWKLALGAQLQLKAYAVYSDSTEDEITTSGESNWSIPNTDHTPYISVENSPELKGLITAKQINDNVFTVQLTNNDYDTLFITTADFVIGEPIIEFIEISPNTQTIVNGDTLLYTAKAFDSNDNIIVITNEVVWSTSGPTIADFNQTGSNVLKSLAVGSTYVEASYTPVGQAEITTKTLLTVAPAVIRSIVIEPQQARFTTTPIPVALFLKGDDDKLSAKGHYSDGTIVDISSEVTWLSSAPNIAQVSSAFPLPGMLSPLTLGQTTIHCEIGIEELGQNKTITTDYLIEVGAPLLEFIEITPTTPIFVKDMRKGFIAQGVYSDNSVQDLTDDVIWSTGRAGENAIDKAGSIINEAPNKGLFTAERLGETLINASLTNYDGYKVLKQTLATVKTLDRIEVTRNAGTIYAGNKVYVSATAYSETEDEMLFTEGLTWTVSSLATFDNTTITHSENVITTLSAGTVAVAASWDIKDDAGNVIGTEADTLTITVDAPLLTSLVLSSSDIVIPRGTNAQLLATATYSDGSSAVVNSAVTWTNTNNDFVTVNETTGLITATNTGEVSIATYITNAAGEVINSNSVAITVELPVLQSLSAVLSDLTIPRGTSATISVTGTLSDGTTGLPENVAVTILSSDIVHAPLVNNIVSVQPTATIGSTLSFTISAPKKAGSTELITANIITASVASPLLVSMNVGAINTVIPRGNSTTLTLNGLLSDNTVGFPVGVAGTWQSADLTKASVDTNTGAVTIPNNAMVGSSVVITVTAPIESGSTNLVTQSIILTVGYPVVEGINITTATSDVRKGKSITPSFVVQMSDADPASVPTLVWSSSNELFAKVNSTTGVVTIPATASVGNLATITASAPELPGSPTIISDSFEVTVTAASLESISLSPGNTTIHRGLTLTLVPIGLLSDSSNGLPTALTWTSADTDKAVVTNGVVAIPNSATVGATVTITVSAADAVINPSSTITETITITVGEPLVESITISNGNISVPRGQGIQLNSIIVMSDANPASAPTLTWSSATPSLVTVDTNGYIQVSNSASVTSTVVLTASSLTFQGSSNSIHGEIAVTVGPPVLTGLTISLGNISVRKGESLALDVVGLLSDGSNGIPTQETWLSLDTSIATITDAGMLTVKSAASVSATVTVRVSAPASLSSSTVIEDEIIITVAEPRAQNIDITVVGISQGTVSVVKGGSVQLGSKITMSDGTDVSAQELTWADNSSKLNVDASGLVTLGGGAKEGDTYIITLAMPTYAGSPDTVNDSIELTVEAPILNSITLSPTSSASPQNAGASYSSTNGSVLMAVTNGLMTDGSAASTDVLAAGLKWSSSNAGIANVDENTGVVSIIATSGTAIITGTITVVGNPTITNSITITAIPAILDSIVLSSSDLSIPNGLTLDANVDSGLLTNNTSAPNLSTGLSWTSSNTAVATVDTTTGVVTVLNNATSNATSTITATIDVTDGDDVSASFVVTAIAPVLQSIALSSGNTNLAQGDTLGLTVISGIMSDSTAAGAGVLSTGLSWSSTGTAATVDTGTGVVTADISSGDEIVTASIVVAGYPDGTTAITKTVTITAIAPVLNSIVLSASDMSIPNGETLDANVVSGLLTDGNSATASDLSTGLSWTSSNNTVATVDINTGVVTVLNNATLNATTTITATIVVTDGDDVSASFVVTAIAPVLQSIVLSSGDTNLAQGDTLGVTVISGIMSDSTAASASVLSTGLSWTSSNAAVATVDINTGVVTILNNATLNATSTITATIVVTGGDDVSVSFVVTAIDAVLASIVLSSSDINIPNGETLDANVVSGLLTDGNSATASDLSTGLSWTSSNATVATVDINTGVVTILNNATLNATSTITATIVVTGGDDVSVSFVVTAIDAVLASIVLSSSDINIPNGETLDANVVSGLLTDGNSATASDLSTGLSWTSSNATVATVDINTGVVTILNNATLNATTTITATIVVTDGDDVSASFVVTAVPAQLRVALTPDEPSLALGTVQTFTPVFSMTDGSAAPVLSASDLTWSSLDNVIASVDTLGVVSTLKEGQVTISAVLTDAANEYAYDVSDINAVTVSAKIIVDFKLYAESSSTLAEQLILRVHPIAIYSDKTTEPYTADLDWSSSDTVNIKIAGTVASSPQVNQITPVSISSVDLSADAPATITVVDNDAGLGSKALAVTFIDATVTTTSVETSVDVVTLPIDVDYPLSAVAILSDNTVQKLNTNSGVAWADNNAGAVSDVTVDGAGGLVTITSAATIDTNITAIYDTITATSALIIKPDAILYSIEIVPGDITLALGVKHNLTALGTYKYDSNPNSKYLVVDISDKVTWTVTNSALATEASSQLVGVSVGSTIITATLRNVTNTADITDTADVTVVEQITLISTIPTTLVLSNDSSLQAQVYPIKAYANYAGGYQHEITEQLYWSSTTELTVSNISGKKGEITPISFSGTPIVTATLFTEKGTAVNDSLAVTFPTRTLTSLAISPPTITLDNDDKQSFTATLTYSDASTNVVTELVTWSIDNAADAFVNNVAGQRGQVSGVGSSTATITVTAKLPGSLCSSVLCTSTATITRQDESATALTITPGTATVVIDATLQFNVTGTFATDGEVDLTEDVVWSTNDPSIATISNKLGSKGLLTRIIDGNIKVTATYRTIKSETGFIGPN